MNRPSVSDLTRAVRVLSRLDNVLEESRQPLDFTAAVMAGSGSPHGHPRPKRRLRDNTKDETRPPMDEVLLRPLVQGEAERTPLTNGKEICQQPLQKKAGIGQLRVGGSLCQFSDNAIRRTVDVFR